MNGLNVKETMEQIHIPEEMQEEIIMNIQNQMENGKNKTGNWRKMATVAAAFVLMAGVVSIPVQAVVNNIVKARMESIPKDEIQAINDTVQEQDAVADLFSRDYSDKERKRMEELEQSYQNGTFPEMSILQVDNVSDVTEDTLSYIKDTGDFYLPDRELTDEEILEIIDFNYTRNYAVEQNPAAQDARDELQAEQAQFREQVQAFGGISGDDAVEIATAQMESELGTAAESKELLNVYLIDITQADYEHKGDVAYIVSFGNSRDKSTYSCKIDAVDGSILSTEEHLPKK